MLALLNRPFMRRLYAIVLAAVVIRASAPVLETPFLGSFVVIVVVSLVWEFAQHEATRKGGRR